jgi:inner membrane protein YidH
MSDIPENLDSTNLAIVRTWLAHERTLMAWVRTGTSMISFGFTIYKFFQFEAGKTQVPRGLIGPRDFALVMVSIGLISLLLAVFQHRAEVRELEAHMHPKPRSLTEVVALLVSLFGLFVLITAIFHI